jgi:iron complex outermembrane receptor protein
MRGFGENSFARVVVLVNGRRLNNPDMQGINWLSIPLSAIERVEVLDGPSGFCMGTGRSAG